MPFVKHEPNPVVKPCHHPEHYPPTTVYLDPGIHTWECPNCGEQAKVKIPSLEDYSMGENVSNLKRRLA